MCGGVVSRLPDGIGTRRCVAPQDVALAVSIEVAGAGNLPVLIGIAGYGLYGGVVARLPDGVLSGGGVAPKDVGLAITVEVAGAGNLPVLVGKAGYCLYGGVVARLPDGVCPCSGVTPQNVALAVSVEVGAGRFEEHAGVAEGELFDAGQGVCPVSSASYRVSGQGLGDGVG